MSLSLSPRHDRSFRSPSTDKIFGLKFLCFFISRTNTFEHLCKECFFRLPRPAGAVRESNPHQRTSLQQPINCVLESYNNFLVKTLWESFFPHPKNRVFIFVVLNLFFRFPPLVSRRDVISRRCLICVSDYLPDCNRGPLDYVPRACQSTTCTYSCWRCSAKTFGTRRCSGCCCPAFLPPSITQWLIRYNVFFFEKVLCSPEKLFHKFTHYCAIQ